MPELRLWHEQAAISSAGGPKTPVCLLEQEKKPLVQEPNVPNGRSTQKHGAATRVLCRLDLFEAATFVDDTLSDVGEGSLSRVPAYSRKPKAPRLTEEVDLPGQ